jgi:sulfur-oxidizing protein SoxY
MFTGYKNPHMGNRRRLLLKMLTIAGVALLGPFQALAAGWNKRAFEAQNLADALKITGGEIAAESKDILIKAPDIAENGAVVPVEIWSKLLDSREILIFAEKNPQPLVAHFVLGEGVEGYISTRIKMGETASVRAVVNAGGKLYYASKEVKVTIGGCG